nr:immunoglobulin heavy chain junction region [Mus musculus]
CTRDYYGSNFDFW